MENHPFKYTGRTFKNSFKENDGEAAYCKGDILKFMISARDYKSGWLFLAFSNKLDPIATGIYAQYLIHNLESAGVDLSEVSFQTDNGTEFVDRLRYHKTFFQDILSGQVEHRIIPPASPRYNSDVESFHGRVENELLKLEYFDSFPDFMSKAFLYNIYFNMFRKNRNRNNQTPADIICQDNKELKPTNLILPPILCDNFRKDYLSINDPVYFNGLPLTNAASILYFKGLRLTSPEIVDRKKDKSERVQSAEVRGSKCWS